MPSVFEANLIVDNDIRLKTRKYLYSCRRQLSHLSVLFGMIGILLAIIEGELRVRQILEQGSWSSICLKSVILASSVMLVGSICLYHITETKLDAVDAGFDNWHIAISRPRLTQMLVEILVCAFCPTPFTHSVTISTTQFPSHHQCEQQQQQHISTSTTAQLHLDSILTIPMFLRLYLVGRVIVLHSRQFQDPSTRAIAALNRVSVNFKFVIKSMIQDYPATMVSVFTLIFWLSISWAFLQCERVADSEKESLQYSSALWFTVITFMTIGFGDVVPSNYCGRVLAVCNRIVGMLVVSAIISVIGDNLDMSNSAQRVNTFLISTELDKKRKNAAASIIQHLWFVYKYRKMRRAPMSTLNLVKQSRLRIRLHQRKLLQSIIAFQASRQKQRGVADQGALLVDVVQVQNAMKSALLKASVSHQELAKGIIRVSESLLELEQSVALRGFNYKFTSLHNTLENIHKQCDKIV